MRRITCVAVVCTLLAGCGGNGAIGKNAEPVAHLSGDWPGWRGPGRNGIAAPDQRIPLRWSQSENVVWSSPVPGRGHGSPAVYGDQVFLATADNDQQIQSVVCYDRWTGEQRWRTDVHRGGFVPGQNGKSSNASSTVACDGERIYVNFLNDDAVRTTALSRDGKQIWQTRISGYVVHQGYGASPLLYQSLVIVAADNKGGGVLTGLDCTTGDVVWKNNRPKLPNYVSPVILHTADGDQLLHYGCDLVSSFDPLTGAQLWESAGATTESVTTAVSDGQHVFTSGGYPKNFVAAVRIDGSGQVVWENETRVYVPSMICHDGYLYAIADAGIAYCWKADTGQKAWKHRLGGSFSSSPVLVGMHILATNELGQTFVFEATPESFQLVAQNQLGDHVMASPAVCGGRIFVRVAFSDAGNRKEMLYCLGPGG